jgi:hypothetical protein
LSLTEATKSAPSSLPAVLESEMPITLLGETRNQKVPLRADYFGAQMVVGPLVSGDQERAQMSSKFLRIRVKIQGLLNRKAGQNFVDYALLIILIVLAPLAAA